MNPFEWLVALFHPKRPTDPAKEELTRRQLELADRVAVLTRKTRDQVLEEAYHRVKRR